MKKGLIYIALAAVSLQACRKEDNTDNLPKLSVTERNTYDDQAISKFLEDHYFDEKGNVVRFDKTDESDDNEPKLDSYNPILLPSGVVYLLKPDAQPSPGKTIGDTDIIEIMGTSYNYISKKNDDGIIEFDKASMFMNTITNGGNSKKDPFFYYAKESLLTDGKTKEYYEIEGFQEAIRHFKSCEIDAAENYNLQGVILIPSRAAYARDSNVMGKNFTDRSFMFNFQIYKTTER